MIEQYIEATKTYLEELKTTRNAQTAKLKELEKYRGLFLRGKRSSSGKWYYSAYESSSLKHKYLGGDDNEEVKKIKELRYLDFYINRVDNNIDLIQNTLNKIQNTDYGSINESLPVNYKNPRLSTTASSNKAALWKERAEGLKEKHGLFRAHELKVTVNDGNKVRSKSEGMIYNYLLSVNANFVYELPMLIDGKTILPDFTVLSEKGDFKEIIIEHQGLMGDDYYRKRFSDKAYMYLRNGYIPGINVFFTFDDINGGLDLAPLKDIVKNHVLNYDKV